MEQLKLFPREVSDWFAQFAACLAVAAEKRKWMRALTTLAMLEPQIPGCCDCEVEPRYLQDPVLAAMHKHHADYNRELRAIIMAVPGARAALHKAMYRDLQRVGPEDKWPQSCGRGVLLLDFLRVMPTKAWFRDPLAPVPEGQMYQGSALANQHMTH